jgi:nucleoside-diphosphate-sugar epimerase
MYTTSSQKTDEQLAAQSVIHSETLENASILVAGASGLIGSMLIRTLHELNIKKKLNIRITAASRNIQRLEHRFSSFEDVSIKGLDVSLPTSMNDSTYTHIIHAASQADPSLYKEFPVETMLTNIEGTKNLLNLASKNTHSKFLYISSGEVYGSIKSERFMKEEESGYIDPLNARSCYPSAKRASETLCISYAEEHGIDTRIVRPSHVFGPGFRRDDKRISADFFLKAFSGEDIVLRSTGEEMRTYIYIADCAAGILSVLTRGESKQAYNITNSDNHISMRDFSRTIAEIGGVKFIAPKAEIHSSLKLHRASMLNDTKLRELGWKPQVSVEEGVKRTFEALDKK